MKKRVVLSGFLKTNKGSALMMAVIIMMVVSVLTTMVFTLYNNNLKQAKQQEHYIEAYYLAYSGVEMAFAALREDSAELFEEIKDTETPLTEEDIHFGNGTIDVSVTISDEANYMDWIKITATGTLNESNVSRTRTLYIDPSNMKNAVWKEN